MSERRTFIIRFHRPGDLPIVEDVATGELVRLSGLASIPGELRRRLYGINEVAIDPPDAPDAAREQRT